MCLCVCAYVIATFMKLIAMETEYERCELACSHAFSEEFNECVRVICHTIYNAYIEGPYNEVARSFHPKSRTFEVGKEDNTQNWNTLANWKKSKIGLINQILQIRICLSKWENFDKYLAEENRGKEQGQSLWIENICLPQLCVCRLTLQN